MICVMEAGTCFIFCFHICYTHQWHCYWVVCTSRLSSGWETLVIWYHKKGLDLSPTGSRILIMQCSTFQEMSKKTDMSLFLLAHIFCATHTRNYKGLVRWTGPLWLSFASTVYSNPGKESSLEISRDFKLSERENTVLCWMYSSTFIKIQHPQQFITVKLYVVVVEKENT